MVRARQASAARLLQHRQVLPRHAQRARLLGRARTRQGQPGRLPLPEGPCSSTTAPGVPADRKPQGGRTRIGKGQTAAADHGAGDGGQRLRQRRRWCGLRARAGPHGAGFVLPAPACWPGFGPRPVSQRRLVKQHFHGGIDQFHRQARQHAHARHRRTGIGLQKARSMRPGDIGMRFDYAPA